MPVPNYYSSNGELPTSEITKIIKELESRNKGYYYSMILNKKLGGKDDKTFEDEIAEYKITKYLEGRLIDFSEEDKKLFKQYHLYKIHLQEPSS